MDTDLIARILKRTISDGECIVWIGAKFNGRYGAISFRGKPTLVHRAMYFAHNGEIPKGMLVCHTCDNMACCNIVHLFLGTPKDNAQDCISKGRHSSKAPKNLSAHGLYMRKWRDKNRAKNYGYHVKWRKRYPEKYRELQRLWAAKKRAENKSKEICNASE